MADFLSRIETRGAMSRTGRAIRRRAARLTAALCAGALALAVAGCDKPQRWHETDVTGALPPLAFTMTRADDGKTVTAKDYRGKIVLLYFGYTFCPDVCPTTLSNIARILDGLGEQAEAVRVLFVTVDPNRDTVAVLKQYADAFSPRVDGLRGDPGQLAALAKRYRVAYSVRPKSADHGYEVSHGSAVYVFDRGGKVRLLLSSLATNKPEIPGTTADLKRLIASGSRPDLLHRLLDLL
jgi:protein SCO1/2